MAIQLAILTRTDISIRICSLILISPFLSLPTSYSKVNHSGISESQIQAFRECNWETVHLIRHIPVLVLHGTSDEVVQCIDGVAVSELLDWSRLVLLEDLGHFCWNGEKGERVGREINEFFKAFLTSKL